MKGMGKSGGGSKGGGMMGGKMPKMGGSMPKMDKGGMGGGKHEKDHDSHVGKSWSESECRKEMGKDMGGM